MTTIEQRLARLRQPHGMDRGLTGFALHLFRLRFRRLKLSQRAFAERYGIGYATVRNAEQGATPTPAFRVLVAAIAADPVGMQAVAKTAYAECACSEMPADEHCGGARNDGLHQ